MSNFSDHPDYSDFEAIVRNARMQRSVAVGDAIAGLVAMALSGLARGVNAVRIVASRSRSRGAGNADSVLDVPAHH